VHCDVDRALVTLLSEYAETDMIRHSEISAPLRAPNLGIERTTEVLQAMETVLDDRRPSFEDWLKSKLDALAPGIRRETEQWSRTLHDGGPRTLARDPSTVRIHLKAIRPVLLERSADHDHLREVTCDEVVAHVRTLQGRERHQALVALRPLSSRAKKNGVVFRNPTSRVKVGQAAAPVLQPLPPRQVAHSAEAAASPADRLAVALAAVHAARPGAIRALQLDDIDLGNHRITIAGRSRPLDNLTRQLLLARLEHRRRRWPNTANPHLIITMNTAPATGPVGSWWIERELRGQAATLDRLRIDRQPEEALVHGPDPLHLAEVFGMDEKTAIRYADPARQLLEQSLEADTTEFPRTRGPIPQNPGNEPSSSR
jgi:integrase